MPAIEPVDYTESLMADRGMPPGYEVLGELGRGGFGEVVLARHTTLDRLVAIKRIPVAALHYAEAVARFQREARVLAALDHPGIVAVYDFRLGPLGAALIMEYVPGQSLRQALDRGPLSPALGHGHPRRRRRGAGCRCRSGHRAPGRQAGQRVPAGRRCGETR